MSEERKLPPSVVDFLLSQATEQITAKACEAVLHTLIDRATEGDPEAKQLQALYEDFMRELYEVSNKHAAFLPDAIRTAVTIKLQHDMLSAVEKHGPNGGSVITVYTKDGRHIVGPEDGEGKESRKYVMSPPTTSQ